MDQTEDVPISEDDIRADEKKRTIRNVTWVAAFTVFGLMFLADLISIYAGLSISCSGLGVYVFAVLVHWISRSDLTDYLEPIWLGAMLAGLMILASSFILVPPTASPP